MTTNDNRNEVISNTDDPRLQAIRQLRSRPERERTGLFWMEGIRFLIQAVEQRAAIQTLVVSPPLLANTIAKNIVRGLRRSGVPCLCVPPGIFRSLSLSAEPQGVGAVVRQHWESLPNIQARGKLCWVAVDTVQSPGNLGTILRTCDAVGAAGVILIGDATDPYDPAAVRATMGALFSQRFVRASFAEFAAWKKRHGCLLVGTSPAATTDYRAVSYRAPTILFMGWERQGLPEAHQALCDIMVRIPMVGRSDSLNLAVATGVMLYEVFNQRRSYRPQQRHSGTRHR